MSGSGIRVVRSSERSNWTPLVDPPGEAGTGGAETTAFTSADGAFTVGLWTREPDTWSFERPYDEVALILEGSAEMEAVDGTVHSLRPGTVVVTPNGAKGTWRIAETLTKCFVIVEGGAVDDTTIRTVDATSDDHDWSAIPTRRARSRSPHGRARTSSPPPGPGCCCSPGRPTRPARREATPSSPPASSRSRWSS